MDFCSKFSGVVASFYKVPSKWRILYAQERSNRKTSKERQTKIICSPSCRPSGSESLVTDEHSAVLNSDIAKGIDIDHF